MSIIVVSGTGTDVGKTVVTAAVAAQALVGGQRVAVIKPAQTGVTKNEAGDIDEIIRLIGSTANDALTCIELARYPEPLAPRTAARRAAQMPTPLNSVVDTIENAATTHDLVLVEGAGGLLVQFDEEGNTIADLTQKLQAQKTQAKKLHEVRVLIVVAAGLGTLNTTALTAEALQHRNLDCMGIVIGRWPMDPDLAAQCNLSDLPDVANAPLLGILPEGCATDPNTFAERTHHYLSPELGGDAHLHSFDQDSRR